ncbi:MAG: hypothetical protein LBT45_00095, partial [Rickettsiales bacterium]|nr:hypothetical protein [Rickettsiales bacterium]
NIEITDGKIIVIKGSSYSRNGKEYTIGIENWANDGYELERILGNFFSEIYFSFGGKSIDVDTLNNGENRLTGWKPTQKQIMRELAWQRSKDAQMIVHNRAFNNRSQRVRQV